MNGNHTIRVPIPIGRKSVAYWALARPNQVVIFIHGFRGSADGTWGRAADLARRSPCLTSSDLIFFDYPCARKQVPRLAADVVELLDWLTAGDALQGGHAFLHQLRGGKTEYDRFLIVAHSLGAVVARRALLDGVKASRSWIDKIHFILFAPAHLGARVKTLVDLTLGKIPFPVDALLKAYYPVLDELEPGSTTLKLIYDESVALYPALCSQVKARAVAMADDEQVVDTNAFFQDPTAVPIKKTDHISVVKCRTLDADPYRKLESWLTPARP